MSGRVLWLEMAIGLGLGIVSWRYWQPTAGSILFGMVGLTLVILWTKQTMLHHTILVLLSFLLGSGRLSALENVSETPSDLSNHSILWVTQTYGTEALLENEHERWRMRFYADVPAKGDLIGVWHTPKSNQASWKGAIDPDSKSDATRRPERHVKGWTSIIQQCQLKFPNLLGELEHGGIIWALVSGDKKHISNSSKRLMRNTGTSHLLAISGMHIGMLSMFAYGFVHWTLGWLVLVNRGKWVRRLALLTAILVAWLYGNQVEWPASAQRSVAMISMISVGKMLEVDISLWSVVGIAAFGMLCVQPEVLYDLGFQLSFSAVVGIGMALTVGTKWVNEHFNGGSKIFMMSILVSVGATLGTLPICAWMFQSMPLTGVCANVLAGPLMGTMAVPLSMMGTIMLQIDCLVIGAALLSLADACIELTTWWLEPLDNWVIPLAFEPIESLMSVASICLMCSKWLRTRFIGMITLVVLCIQASPIEQYWRVGKLKDDLLRIRFLNVGQGDATLIEWGNGPVWLVDGGPFSFNLVPYLKREGIWHIDQIWLTHPHADHMEGLSMVVQHLSVDMFVIGRMPNEYDDMQYHALIKMVVDRGIQLKLATEMQEAVSRLGGRILHPLHWKALGTDRFNEESVVLELTHSNHRVLLTGDIEEDAEAWLLNTVRPLSVLKVAHHGSRSSSSPEFIEQTQPLHSVISAGAQNVYQHPHASTLWNLRHSKVWRTDLQGTIVVEIDSNKLLVHTE